MASIRNIYKKRRFRKLKAKFEHFFLKFFKFDFRLINGNFINNKFSIDLHSGIGGFFVYNSYHKFSMII